jgi:hypothetical protein
VSSLEGLLGVVAAGVVSAGVVFSFLVDLQDAKADTKSKRATVIAIILFAIKTSPLSLFFKTFITK